MIKNTLFSMLLFMGSISVLYSQNIEFSPQFFPNKDQKKALTEAIKHIKQGDRYYATGQGMYVWALDEYQKAYEFNPNNALLNFKMGYAYLNTFNKAKAIEFFRKAAVLNPEVDPNLNYYMGKAYQQNHDFDKALYRYYLHATKIKENKIPDLIKDVENGIAECKNAQTFIKDTIRLNENGDTIKITITNLGVALNTSYAEYNPHINADESMMIFTSQRKGGFSNTLSPQDWYYYEDLYVATKKDSLSWNQATNMGKPLNTFFNDAVVGLSPDGQKLFTYKGDDGGDLYYSELQGKLWSKPVKLNKNINTPYHESSASFSYDGRKIYFESTKPGGLGGSDLYIAQMDSATKDWGVAVNLGNVINTSGNERGVFMHPDGKTIYFSSDGHKTMGGLDILKSVYNEETKSWSTPENLGYPINSADDDVFFSVSSDGLRGYYSSMNKGGLGSHDIYMVTYKTEPNQLTILKGVVMDQKTLKPLEAKIEISDNETGELIAEFTSNSATGKYLVSLPSGKNYKIGVKADGYLYHSENIDVKATKVYKEIEKDFKLKKIEIGERIVLKNIFFDLDKATLRPESMVELQKLLKFMTDNSKIKIEIAGHTDNQGSAAHNKTLSMNRAKAVVDYLIANNIAEDRMRFAGYGYDRPIATNKTEEGRQLNRRTEFEILSNN